MMNVVSLSAASVRFAVLLALGSAGTLLSATAVDAHSGGHPVRFVASDGVDRGDCASPKQPCKTIAFAAQQSGKGDSIRVAAGDYLVGDNDVFYLLSDMVPVRGGFLRKDGFKNQNAEQNLTTVIGLPAQYRERLAEHGFRLLQDSKGQAVELSKHTQKQLALYQSNTQKTEGPATCVNGMAAGYECQNVDLLFHIPLGEFSSRPGSANDIWGFQDLNNQREYVLIGLQNGTAVVDVTDPINAIEVGTIAGNSSTWRDIKVYQYFDADANRYKAYGYVTTEANQGLQVLDLTELPTRVTLANTINDFSTAHNVYLANTDYSTGVALPAVSPYLIVSGANKNSGAWRLLGLSNPTTPNLLLAAPAGTGYIHDASSVVIEDARTAECANNHNPCEVLIDFNENTVDLWDVTDKAAPFKLSSTPYPNARYTHSGWWTPDKRHVLIHDELDEQQAGLNTTVRSMNIDSLRNPVLVGTYTGPTRAIDHNGFTRDNRHYISNYRRGLVILDTSNPAQPGEVGFFDTFASPTDNSAQFNGAWGTYPFLPSGTIAVSDIEYGLFLLKDNTGSVNSSAGALAFSGASASVNEGAGTVTLTVRRVGGSSGDVSVDYLTRTGSAGNADYSDTSGTLNWANNNSSEQTITINITDDSNAESSETFTVELRDAGGGATLGTPTRVTVTVADNDSSGGDSGSSGGGGGSTGWLLTAVLAALGGHRLRRRQ